MNSLITRAIAKPIPIRFYSTPIFTSNDSNKYIDFINSKKKSYKNKNNSIKGLNKKEVSYSSSNYKSEANNSYKYMYNALPINNVYKTES